MLTHNPAYSHQLKSHIYDPELVWNHFPHDLIHPPVRSHNAVPEDALPTEEIFPSGFSQEFAEGLPTHEFMGDFKGKAGTGSAMNKGSSMMIQ